MTIMKKKIPNYIRELNRLSITDYLNNMGNTPLATTEHAAEYEVCLRGFGRLRISVDPNTNRFTDKDNNREGGLVDLACLMFQVPPSELYLDPIAYDLHTLMHTTA